tara:strand:- start:26 stop:958 length:933 start_codon:yes stop_codon:yes gene_type:complete
MKKTLKEQLDRSKELIQFDKGLILNEQTGPCMEISAVVCYEGNIGLPPGTPVQFPCSLLDMVYADNGDVGDKVQDMGVGYGQGTYKITSVSANPNYTGPTPSDPHLSIHGAWKYPCGPSTSQQDLCQCCNNGSAQSMSAPVPVGTCSSYNSNTLSNCQVAPAQGSIQCSIDCTQYGVDYDPTTLINAGSFFQVGINAVNNGNCNPILNKITAVNGISNQQKKNCRLDYLNELLIACQGNSGLPSLNPAWINLMTNRYNGTGALSGCWGLTGTNTNSACGRKAHFCPGNTPMKQAKCQWLTNFTSTNNCNC